LSFLSSVVTQATKAAIMTMIPTIVRIQYEVLTPSVAVPNVEPGPIVKKSLHFSNGL